MEQVKKKKNKSWLVQLFSPAPVVVKPRQKAVVAFKKSSAMMSEPRTDALVEIGRDLAANMHAHPERYIQIINGQFTLVIDDAGYEAIFYLFSGHTQATHYAEKGGVAIIFLGTYPVLSKSLVNELTQ